MHIPPVLRCFRLALCCFVLTGSAGAQTSTSGLVHTPEVDLAYEILGSDTHLPPVFAVNGGPGLTHAYMVQNDLWSRLARTRKVVFYDQRGDGHSTRLVPNAPQTLEAQVADLEAVRTFLKADRIDLVGDSYGGMLVLAYTLAHPEHVAHLVVSDGLPGFKGLVHPMPDIFPDIDAESDAKLQQMPKGKQADDYAFSVHLRKCFYSPELAEQYLAHFHDFELNRTVGDEVSTAIRDVDLSPRLGTITAPTLILTGRFDVNVAPLTAYRMVKAIPGAEFHVFEHSGHLPSYEEPAAYLQQLTAFLSR